MVFIYIYIILNFLLISSKENITDILVLKLKTYYPQTDNMRKNNSDYNFNDFIDSYLFSEIYLELENNNDNKLESNQVLKTIIKSETNSFILRNLNINHFSFCTFNTSLSLTFKNNILSPSYCQSEEVFKIYIDLSFSNFKLENFTLDNYFCLNDSICGEIGTDISSYQRTTQNNKDFISKMNNVLNSGEQNFAFHFSKEEPEEGIFVFGAMPHNYFKNKYNENDIITFYSDNSNFEIILDTITFNGKEYFSNETENEEDYIHIKISPDFEGIEFDKFFMDILINIYFNKYIKKNICRIENTFSLKIVIYCYGDKFGKKDIKEFPQIVFTKYKYNFNISFKNEDLFYFKNNKYYFKIFCKYNQYKRFALGRIFLKNYLTVFNADKKQIYFYNKLNEENISKTFYEKNKTLIIILILIGFIIFLFTGIFIGKLLFKERKRLANELNDKYEYKTNNNTNTNENLYNPEEDE